MKACEQGMKDMFCWPACLLFAFSTLSLKISSRIRTGRHISVVFCQFNPSSGNYYLQNFLGRLRVTFVLKEKVSLNVIPYILVKIYLPSIATAVTISRARFVIPQQNSM
jgi:hypothetical protein